MSKPNNPDERPSARTTPVTAPPWRGRARLVSTAASGSPMPGTPTSSAHDHVTPPPEPTEPTRELRSAPSPSSFAAPGTGSHAPPPRSADQQLSRTRPGKGSQTTQPRALPIGHSQAPSVIAVDDAGAYVPAQRTSASGCSHPDDNLLSVLVECLVLSEHPV